MMELFIAYVKRYIAALTEGKEEYFLSICDVEEEPLSKLTGMQLEDCVTLVIDKEDYSEAVRVRNDINVTKIVLLSSEGIKQIDSLKDFNEYSVLCADRKLRWDCLQGVFEVPLRKELCDVMDVILEESEVSFWEFFKFLYEVIDSDGVNIQKFNNHLSSLRIWKSNESRVLTKGRIRRMIRASRESLVERRLTKALMEHKKVRKAKYISNCLAKGDIQGIFAGVYFEEVEEWLKGSVRSSELEMSAAEETEEEKYYRNSYEYLIGEHLSMPAEELERSWMEEREETQEESAEGWRDWHSYMSIGGIGLYEQQRQELQSCIGRMNILPEKEEVLLQKLKHFCDDFERSYEDVLRLTPICLKSFCEAAVSYTQSYFELLSYILTDEMIREELKDSGLVSRLQCFLCEMVENKVRMPFYHPVTVLYYIALKKMYEFAMSQESDAEITDIVEVTLLALIRKLGMQFPVEFMLWENELYALDYTTICNSTGKNKGAIEFINTHSEVVYSVLDFRVVSKQITDYIARHAICTELTIALVEISDLNGLPQLVDKIQHMAHSERYNIGRVNFLILSSKEEELKKQLSRMWDVIGTEGIVRYRFGRDRFYGTEGYDMEAVITAADMTIIADCSTLYYEPRKEQYRKRVNPLRNRLAAISISQQSEMYFQNGCSDIAILWDTLQHAQNSRDEGFWYWKSREIDNNILSYINQAVSQEAGRTIVALSSNDNILNDIHKSRYIRAYRKTYNAKTITIIHFDRGNCPKPLPVYGEAGVSYSLSEFYDATLDIPEIHSYFSSEFTDFLLQLYLKDGKFHCECTACTKENAEQDENWRKACNKWMKWQLETFVSQSNILSDYFYDLWMTQWAESAKSITAALAVRKLYAGANIEVRYVQCENVMSAEEILSEDDCMEAVKVQDILEFVDTRRAIDSQTVKQFGDKYDWKMLDNIIACDGKEHILDEEQREKLTEIQQKTKGE